MILSKATVSFIRQKRAEDRYRGALSCVQFGENNGEFQVHEYGQTFATVLDEVKQAGNTCSLSCSYPSDSCLNASIPTSRDCKHIDVRD
jgi:hypothetical protein